jgi:hypothetical protein
MAKRNYVPYGYSEDYSPVSTIYNAVKNSNYAVLNNFATIIYLEASASWPGGVAMIYLLDILGVILQRGSKQIIR